MELEALNEVVTEIRAVGADLVVIAPQLQKFSRQLTEKYKLKFDILSDHHNSVASEFGLTFALPEDLRAVYLKFGTDLARFNGDDSWTLPMPSRFIIDTDSKIVSAEVNPDYTRRPDPADIVAALRPLRV